MSLVLPESGGLERLAALSPEEVKAWAERVQEVRRAVLVEGVDFGQIPGTERPTLYDAGAQKMALLAGVGFKMERLESTAEGVTYHCSVFRGGELAAECEGYAGYDEERFYQSAEHQRAKAERKERYWAAHDRRPVKAERFAAEAFTDYRAPRNTLIKMAQKRARVGAISAALALGGLFELEADDTAPDAETGEIPRPPEASATAGAAPGSRRPVERRRPEQPPESLYDDLPEAQG